MFKWFLKLFFRFTGWKVDRNLPEYGRQAVLVAAPHTSNWDFIYAIAAFDLLKIPIKFTIKQDWLRWPFKKMMLRFGAIPIDRSPKVPGQERKSMVEAMADLFEVHDDLIMVVQPEGTRSKVVEWKTGYYHIARNANVPIILSYFNYKTKRGAVSKIIFPSDDMEADMKEIMKYYEEFGLGKFPDKFSLDRRYSNL